ncbi:MAG TPA: hypothetical protein VMG12_39035, partial [Polyangiaceae bacterium]|nr:hypothetical protein [Polyangiaceae bacterium]
MQHRTKLEPLGLDTHPRRSRQALLALAAAAALACSGDEEANAAPSGTGSGPLYLIAASFISGDQTETYLVTSPTFDESTTIDPTDGPQLLGGIVPVVRNGSVYAPDSNGPVLVRYDVGADNRLVRGAELSFAGVGMSSLMGWHVHAVSDTQGYVFDPSGPRVIGWNPTTMELTGTQIDLGAVSRDGWTPSLNFEFMGPRRRDAQLVVPVSWQDQDGNSRFASGVAVIDTETDQLIAVDEDERCGEAHTSIEAPNGDIYFFPPAWSSTQHFFVDMHRPTCAVGLGTAQTSFDAAPTLDLSGLGSGSAVSSGIPDGQGGFFFTTVDESLWDARASDVAPFWRMWHHDFASGTSREVTSLPPFAGQAYYVPIGDRTFVVFWEETATGHRTTLYRVDGANDPARVFSFDA